MTHALLVALGADPADGRLAGRLLRALPSTERDFPTLDVIAAELDKPDEQPAPPGLALSFGVRDVRNQAELLPDNGHFHVVVGEGAMSLSIVGMDQQLRLTLDAEGRPVACAVLDASPAALSWAIATRALSFAGTCSLFQGKCELAGVAALLSMPGLQLALEERRTGGRTGTRPGPARPVQAAACEPSRPGHGCPADPPASDRWRALMEAEEGAVPFVVASGHSRREAVVSRHYVECENAPEQLDVGAREVVKVSRNGRQVAELDLARTRGSRLALARFRGYPIGPGDRLDLQSAESRASFDRRQLLSPAWSPAPACCLACWTISRRTQARCRPRFPALSLRFSSWRLTA